MKHAIDFNGVYSHVGENVTQRAFLPHLYCDFFATSSFHDIAVTFQRTLPKFGESPRCVFNFYVTRYAINCTSSFLQLYIQLIPLQSTLKKHYVYLLSADDITHFLISCVRQRSVHVPDQEKKFTQ